MNKQEMLNKAREIKKGCGGFKFFENMNHAGFTCGDNRLHEEGDLLTLCPECKKQLQEIKDKWKDGCGKETEWANMIYSCGNFEDLKHSDHYIFCPTCEKQNKEFKEICLEVLE